MRSPLPRMRGRRQRTVPKAHRRCPLGPSAREQPTAGQRYTRNGALQISPTGSAQTRSHPGVAPRKLRPERRSRSLARLRRARRMSGIVPRCKARSRTAGI
jgi:hypothetical protein